MYSSKTNSEIRQAPTLQWVNCKVQVCSLANWAMACSHQWHRFGFPKQHVSRKGKNTKVESLGKAGKTLDLGSDEQEERKKNHTATQAKITASFQCQNERHFYKKDIQVQHMVMHSPAALNTQMALSAFRWVNKRVFLHQNSVVTHLAQNIYLFQEHILLHTVRRHSTALCLYSSLDSGISWHLSVCIWNLTVWKETDKRFGHLGLLSAAK